MSHLSSHTLSHNSIRYERFFDVFECVCKSNIELQSKPLITQFNYWVQKLLNCKSWALWKLLNFFDSRVARSILFIEFWFIQK